MAERAWLSGDDSYYPTHSVYFSDTYRKAILYGQRDFIRKALWSGSRFINS